MAFIRKARKYVKKGKGMKKRINRKPKVSVNIKKYVKKIVHGEIENKCVQINGSGSFGNVLEDATMNAYPMCPLNGYWSIPQGVLQGNRVGNQIKTRKTYLNYVLRPNPYDGTTNPFPAPMEIQLMLGYTKNTPTYIPVAFDINQLYQAGSAVAAPQGTLRDIVSVINTDYWVIKKRWTHKVGFGNYQGTAGSNIYQYHANNDFKMNVVKRIDITKMMPATHVFNDAGITPTSKNLFFMYQAVNANGSNFGVFTPANIEFWIDFHYEDA